MKKKICTVLLSLTLSIALIACGGTVSEGNGGSDTTGNSKTESGTTQDTTSSEGTTESGENSTGSEEKGAKTTQEMYEDFLADCEKVYPGNRKITYYDSDKEAYVPYFDNLENGYTLSELIKYSLKLEERLLYEPMKVENISYTFLDCGQDGEPELAVQVNYLMEYDGMDREYVIKNIDGKLCLCCQLESYYRYYEGLTNKYGKISAGGSFGASESTYTVAYLDGKGDYRYGYTEDTSYSLYSFGPQFDQAAQELFDEEAWGGMYYHNTYSFEEYDPDQPDSYEENLLYCAEVPEEEIVGNGLDADENLAIMQQLFELANVPLTSRTDIDQKIADREKEIGVTQEMKESYDIEWTNLEKNLDDINGVSVVTVSNVDGLMNALAENTTILLKPGEYNVTEWTAEQIRKGTLDGRYGYDGIADEVYDNTSDEEGLHLYYRGSDEEPELLISGLTNCSIRSEDSSNPASIVCTPRSATVVILENCKDVTFDSIVMGHTQGNDSCSGDVLSLSNCEKINVDHCDLYGCGATAIDIYDCFTVNFNDCIIHDCTVGCVYAVNSSNVNFADTEFKDVDGYSMFSIFSSYIYFNECNFRNLAGTMVYGEDIGYVGFYECRFDDDLLEQIKAHKLYNETIFINSNEDEY